MRDYDVIVVGAGVIGLCTGHYLAQNGHKTLLLEQFPLPHSRGSSCGHSRLAKISHKKEAICKLMPESLNMWKQLEKNSGTSFIINSGHLSIAGTNIKSKILDPVKDNLVKQNEDFTSYRGSEIEPAFPGLRFSDDFEAFFEPNGVVLKADKCLSALQSEFTKHGGVTHDEEPVIDITVVDQSCVKVKTSKVVYTAKSVVLACGPWINKLMKMFHKEVVAQAVRVTKYYWKSTKGGVYSAEDNFPPLVFYFNEYHLYSTPSVEYPGLIKICYHQRSPIDPDQPENMSDKDKQIEKERLEILKTLIREHFPYLEPVPALQENCLQTITPTLLPVVDKHPLYPNIIIGTGFSGGGFGSAPAFGKILGNLATSRKYQQVSREFAFENVVKDAKL